jgi:hypothetical protein
MASNSSITVQYVPTTEQEADIATKPLAFPLYAKFCASIVGW